MNVSDMAKNITSIGNKVYMISDSGFDIIEYDVETKCFVTRSLPMKAKGFISPPDERKGAR